MIVITNDFTNRSTKVDPSKPMTARKALAIRRRLCADECTSGDSLGARGPQEPGYQQLADRAAQCILTGIPVDAIGGGFFESADGTVIYSNY